MKSTSSRLFLLVTGVSIFINTIESAVTIPRSYIVEYAQQDDTHDIINNDLLQYQDLYKIHHTYSSPIFHGMSFSLKESPKSQPQQHQSIIPVAYSSVNDQKHPVFNHLSNNPAIKKIYPIYEVPRPQWMPNSKTYSHTFPYSNNDSQIYDIHQKLGITGRDILIGVLDSGKIYISSSLLV